MSHIEQEFTEEVAALHRFFEDWFHGRGDRTIEEFSDRLDPGFVIVSPHGHRHDKGQIVDAVEARAGGYEVAISTSGATLHIAHPVLVGTYYERQVFRGESTHRIATALVVEDRSAPGGYRWLSVHETWSDEQP